MPGALLCSFPGPRWDKVGAGLGRVVPFNFLSKPALQLWYPRAEIRRSRCEWGKIPFRSDSSKPCDENRNMVHIYVAVYLGRAAGAPIVGQGTC